MTDNESRHHKREQAFGVAFALCTASAIPPLALNTKGGIYKRITKYIKKQRIYKEKICMIKRMIVRYHMYDHEYDRSLHERSCRWPFMKIKNIVKSGKMKLKKP